MREFSTLHLPSQARTLDHARPKSFRRRLRPDMGAELLAAIVVAVLFTLCGAVYFCADLLSSEKFYSNVIIEGVDVGGKSQDEVAQLFAGQSKVPEIGIKLEIDGRQWEISSNDVGAKYNVNDTIRQAYDVGRTGGAVDRLGEILKLRNERREFSFAAIYDDAMLRTIARNISQQASSSPTNAALQFQPGTAEIFTIIGGTPGKSVSFDALYALLKASLDQGVVSELSMKSDIIQPDITQAMIKNQTQLLGTFTTALNADAVRSKNIKLAGDAVNGAVLFPGGEFSFNTRTGERTKAKGYADAPTISGSQLVDAPGGGVCQVSSTIYNAALLAGLDIMERHHHTWPVSYVPAGQDATVDWNNKDLVLKNSSALTVYLILRVDEAKGLVTAEFYGLPGAEAIAIVTDGYETIMPEAPLKFRNPNRPIGWSRVMTAARNGCKVDVYKELSNNTGTQRVLLYTDVYPTQRGEIEIGTKSPAKDSK